MKIILKNGKVITQERVIENSGIVIEDNKIVKIFENNLFECKTEDIVIDVSGDYISPGFIDIHTHGGGGYDFMDGNVEAIIKGAKAHMCHGTTSIIPTTLTSTSESLFKTLDDIKIAKKEMKNGPNIIGLHLEGPYFSMEQKGAQDPKYIKEPVREEYEKIVDYCDEIVRWTMAPELPGVLEMGRFLNKKGIKCSIGHTNAVYSQVLEAYENGFDLMTHFYSGMSSVRRINAYRYAGVVESGYLIDDMYVEVIADGVHLPESLLKLIYKIKGPDRICLVTDSMRAAGMPEGEYVLGNIESGQKVIVEEGVAKVLSREAFAGSVATCDRLIRTMLKVDGVDILQAVKMMTYNPAKVMGIDQKKGSIAVGKDADVVVFDKEITIKSVIINGNVEINKYDKARENK